MVGFFLSTQSVFACNCTCTDDDSSSGGDSLDTTTLVLNLLAILVLVAFSGLFSGLTLGLLGLDLIGLEIVMEAGSEEEKKYANIIYPVRKNGNLLLCTLLLGNVAVNALLSILLADLTSGLIGFLASTILIVIFGEIVPQASCSRYALFIGAKAVPVVKVIMLCLYIFAKPISMALDYALGEEVGTIHSRTELMKLLQIHEAHGAVDKEAGLAMTGALRYKDVPVSDVMTTKDLTFMIQVDTPLNFKTVTDIFKTGFSRIPVYDKNTDDVCGILLTKDLIFIDPESGTTIRQFLTVFGRTFLTVWADDTLGTVRTQFKKNYAHLAIVKDVDSDREGDPVYVVCGLVTMEDILEEILGDEIFDETDHAMFGDDQQIPIEMRNFDYAHLSLINPKLKQARLTDEEEKAVLAHLKSNIPQVKELSDPQLREIVKRAQLVDIPRTTEEGYSLPNIEDILYQRHRVTNTTTIILAGKVTILAGRDEFRSEAGPWSVLAPDALVEADGTYEPDFTAFVESSHVKCIRISRGLVEDIATDKGVYVGFANDDDDTTYPSVQAVKKRRHEMKQSRRRHDSNASQQSTGSKKEEEEEEEEKQVKHYHEDDLTKILPALDTNPSPSFNRRKEKDEELGESVVEGIGGSTEMTSYKNNESLL